MGASANVGSMCHAAERPVRYTSVLALAALATFALGFADSAFAGKCPKGYEPSNMGRTCRPKIGSRAGCPKGTDPSPGNSAYCRYR